MSVSTAAKTLNKKVKKRTTGGNKDSIGKAGKETTTVEARQETVDAGPPTSHNEATTCKDSALNDPAIVAAGGPRRQPLSKKSSVTNMETPAKIEKGRREAEKEEVDSRPRHATIAERNSSIGVPKAPRAMRRGRQSHQHSAKRPPKGSTEEEDESVACATRATPRKDKVPIAATPPRFQATKSKRERATSLSTRANDSFETEEGGGPTEDKSRSVRFQTESLPGQDESVGADGQGASKQGGGSAKEADSTNLLNETLAQQTALNEAAAMLAQSALTGFPHPSLYSNFNLAQQQLASAQVIAQLRASVEGLKALKNFSAEPASAYDARRVPCLTDREDLNTTTNIYVNNLPSHTTDDDLLRLGACFGPVKSHKAIINQETGLCKGYGFIMYEHALDAETAMQQLPLHGLTTSWAKESFSTKLRKLSDNTTSNVYVSNLPLDMTPHQLEQLFAPHLVVSLRILLDDGGASRGVGFVRLRDRDTAQECIDKLHGKILAGQSTPLQARFADSEAQKRLKQSANQTGAKPTTTSKGALMAGGGLLDGSGLADPMYLASLQGLQSWAGFGTPQNSSIAAFPIVSPPLGITSPAMNYSQWSPNMAANAAAANWNLLSSDMYPILNANTASYGLNYGSNVYSPSSMTTSINSPFAQFSNKSLSPLSFASSPLSSASPVLGKGGDFGSRPGSTRSKPTYLPPDVHQQHAKALLEAQAGLTFDSPQAEAFGLSQMLLNSSANEFHQQQQMHQAQGEPTNNALGMSGMTPQDATLASPSFASKTVALAKHSTVSLPSVSPNPAAATSPTAASLSPIRFSLSADPNNPITVEALDQDAAKVTETADSKDDGEGKRPARVSTPMPSNSTCLPFSGGVQVQDPVTEEGDSLVIESGNGSSAIGPFSIQHQPRQAEPVEGQAKTLSKSDSGKMFGPDCQLKSSKVKQEDCETSADKTSMVKVEDSGV